MTFDAINFAIVSGTFILALSASVVIVAILRGRIKRHDRNYPAVYKLHKRAEFRRLSGSEARRNVCLMPFRTKPTVYKVAKSSRSY